MMSCNLFKAGSENPSLPSPSSPKVAGMHWTEETESRLLTIRLSGEIDLQHSPKLRQMLQRKVREKAPLLLLDFREVKYIDSSGLATLVEYSKNSRRYSGRLAVAGLSDRVRSIFDLVRLGEVFGVFTSVTDAKAALLNN